MSTTPSIRAGATYAASAASTSHSVSKPTGTVQGDLLVFAGIFPANPTCPTVNSLPSGWSQLWQDQVTAATKWAKLVSSDSAQFNLASNKAGSSAAQTAASYWADDLGPDVEAYLTIDTNVAIAGDNFRVHARLQQAGGAGTQDGYQVRAQQVSGAANDTIIIDRVTNNANTALATYTQEFAAGDKIGIRCVGNVIQAWYKASAGSWTKLGEVTDSTYSAAGKVGMAVRGTTGKIDNFYAGTVTDGGASAFGAFATLLDDFNRENETPLTGPPPGKFTFFVATKRAGASEPSSYTFGCNINTRPTGSILAIKDTAGIDVSDRATNVGAETDYATSPVTPTADRAFILALYGAFANGSGSALTFTPDGAFTEYNEAENGIHVSIETQYLTQTSAASVSGTATGSISTNFQAAGIIAFKATPANDYFADRETISGESGSTDPVDLTYCTLETGEQGYGSERQTIWYEWTNELSETRQVVFTATFSPGANYGTLIVTKADAVNQIFSPGNLVIQRAAYGTTVIGQFDAQPGETYKIQLGVTSVFSGTVSLSWSTNPAGPSNDDFVNRVSITDETGSTDVVDPTYATIETDEASLNGFKSVWWEFTAPTKGIYSFTPIIDSGTAYSMQLGGYIGSSLASLVSQGSGSTDGTNTYPLGIILDADDVIQLRVAQWYVTDNPTFHFSWVYSSPPVNDDFADRITISGSDSSVAGTTIGATFEVGEPQYYGSDFQSVWYEWVAPADGNYLLETTKGANNASHYTSVFTGDSVDALTGILTATNWGVLTATAGTVYKIRIGAFYTPGSADLYAGAFTFTWKPAIPATTTPSYDNIADAYILVQDGTQYITPQLTLYGATMETNEETQGEGFGGIWLKIDLSSGYYDPDTYVDIPVTITPYGDTSGAYMAVYAVSDASFDPTNPDFSKLSSYDYSNNGGGDYTFSLLPSDSINRIFYVWVGNSSWNPYETGGTTVTYNIPGPSLPPPVPTNTDCANAQVLSGVSGIIDADNRGWDGIWPTGADPLFIATMQDNYAPGGGGAPLWYKWTNQTGRRVLFQVTVSAPADHPVDYNFGMIIADDCGSIVFNTDYSTIVFGINEEFAAYNNGYKAASWYGPEYTSSFDIIVDPNHTVYIEIDSWTGITTEPPVADAAHRGKFHFEWAALTYTTEDTTTGHNIYETPTADIIVAKLEEDLADFDENNVTTALTIDPVSLIRVGSRLFFLWSHSYSNGYGYYVGDCALDGSDVHRYLFIDTRADHAPYPPGPENGPKLLTDGVDVFVSWLWRDNTTSIPNYDCTDNSGDYPNVCYTFGGCGDLNQWRFEILKWNSSTHAWDDFYSIGGSGNVAFRPDAGVLVQAADLIMNIESCMSSAQPGVIWVAASYVTTRIRESYHFNDYPLFGCGPLTGAIYMTEESRWIEETNDIFRIDDGVGTLVQRDTNYIAETYKWVWDHAYVNPVFGQWQGFSDGEWYTDPSGTQYPSILRRSMSMINDEGYPILAYSPVIAEENGGVGIALDYSEYLTIKRPDTDTVLQNWTYGDVNLGYEIRHDLGPMMVALTDRYFNHETRQYERGLSTVWVLGSYTRTYPYGWLVRVPSDFSGPPVYIDPNNYFSSGWLYANGGRPFTPVLFKDNRPGQWWATGYSEISTWGGYQFILLYSLCGPNWDATYNTYPGDGWTETWPISQVIYWDADNEDFYFIHGTNKILKAHVLRDRLICEIGGAPTPCPPSVFWFYRDGQWRQQNVDTEHSLYVYINGEWVQDCRELKGRLDEQWQN